MLSAAVVRRHVAGFVYEDFPQRRTSTAGGRPTGTRDVRAQVERPGAIVPNLSVSAGVLVMPNDATTIAVNIARAVRNPAPGRTVF